MSIALQLEPTLALPSVEYRWDSDTRILSAALTSQSEEDSALACGANGSIEVEGEDGSWLTLDLDGGCVRGVQVAVWPPVRRRPGLSPPPARVGRARLALPASAEADLVLSLEVTAPLHVEADPDETHFHFVLGQRRAKVSVAIAADILLELDARDHLSGLWLLNVPPTPIIA